MHIRTYFVVGFATLNAFGISTALAQHVHGVLEIGVVIDGSVLAVSLEAPLADVVGFEHAPRDDAQAERLREAAKLLWSAENMFAPPEAAACTVSDVEVEAPGFMDEIRGGAGASETVGAPSDHDDHGDAAEADDHDHHDDHDGHADHADVNAQYVWRCDKPQKIDVLSVRFSRGFANVETVHIQILTPAGTRVLETNGRLDSISLVSP